MPDPYTSLKFLHLIGVILLVGNVTVTASWKVYADFSGDPRIIAHAQRSVTLADWLWTLLGIALVMIGGYGAALVQGIGLFDTVWMVSGQALFLLSGLIWLGLIVPVQARQAREARAFAISGIIPDSYWRLSRWWMILGVAATIPLIAAIWVMVAKP
jgi:uncharacterized membrane protein